jgi:hypothetical protein
MDPGTRGAYSHSASHTGHVLILEAFRNAASGLAEHPQDHGWRDLYRVFSDGLDRSAPNLTATVLAHHSARPTSSETHLLTLLGIALKEIAPDTFESIVSGSSANVRLAALEETLDNYGAGISEIIRSRQNSFTSARRFLVPQVILSAYFAQQDGQEARFADFGTGLGILPRQLNSPEQYGEFAADLVWPNGVPAFRQIPLAARFGVDRGPMPDLNWVHACYGKSQYYAHLYNELLHTRASPEVKTAEVEYKEIDLLDFGSVVAFIHTHKINVANLTYVLYELERAKRSAIVKMLISVLYPPGILLVSEPHKELHSQGVVVELFNARENFQQTLCYVTDGHYKGYILPLEDYDTFMEKYPIEYRLALPLECNDDANPPGARYAR